MGIPISLQIRNKHILIVGAGKVALKKALQFQQEGAHVTILSKEIKCREFYNYSFTIIEKSFEKNDIKNSYFLIYAATNDTMCNHNIIEEANRKNILCGCCQRNDAVSFCSMAYRNIDTMCIAISTRCPSVHSIFLQNLIQNMDIDIKKVNLLAKFRLTLQQRFTSTQFVEFLRYLYQQKLEIIQKIIYGYDKKIIFLAYHGVADLKHNEVVMNQLRCKLEEAYPNYHFIETFLSKKIQQKAQKKGYLIPYLYDILPFFNHLEIAYFIQPILVQNGFYKQQLEHEVSSRLVGEVLIYCEEDMSYIVDQFNRIHGEDWVGVYHDSAIQVLLQSYTHKKNQFYKVNKLQNNSLLGKRIIPFIMLYGYHMKKDLEETCLTKDVQTKILSKGLLSYEFIQEYIIKKMKKNYNI